MRSDLSVNPWAKHFMPYLDGEPLDHCRMADEEFGCAEVYETEVGPDGMERRLPSTRMVFGHIELQPVSAVGDRIKTDPERAQAIWDEYYQQKFGPLEREIAAGPWEARLRR